MHLGSGESKFVNFLINAALAVVCVLASDTFLFSAAAPCPLTYNLAVQGHRNRFKHGLLLVRTRLACNILAVPIVAAMRVGIF